MRFSAGKSPAEAFGMRPSAAGVPSKTLGKTKGMDRRTVTRSGSVQVIQPEPKGRVSGETGLPGLAAVAHAAGCRWQTETRFSGEKRISAIAKQPFLASFAGPKALFPMARMPG
jgi:hypothetical protein